MSPQAALVVRIDPNLVPRIESGNTVFGLVAGLTLLIRYLYA